MNTAAISVGSNSDNNRDPLLDLSNDVYRISGHRREPISINDVIKEVVRGELVVIPAGMQTVGLFHEICSDTLGAIDSAASVEKSDLIRAKGFERMHEILTAEEIFKVNQLISAKLNGKAISIVRRVVEDLLGHRSGFYALKMVMARFFTPFDHFTANKALFSQRLGSLKIQNPHRDSWFTHAKNGLNLWIAIGRVSPGNGMLVYPAMWQKPVKHHGIHFDRNETFLGQPVNFTLNPGDMLLFHGEHLHSSELNYTQDTRFVLTSRFTLESPVYGEGPRWIPHFYTPWLDGKLEKFASLRSHFDMAFLRWHFDKFCGRYRILSRFRNTEYDDK